MKNNNIKVSVILPVYNVEPYLHECMDSVIHQTLHEIEIICVDDGSTDNSLNILKEYAKKDKRIIILEQENQGAGVARNTGLDIAQGDYLSFLDPDDFFELNMLEAAHNKALETDVDIVIYQSNSYDEMRKTFNCKVGGWENGINYEYLPNKLIFSYKDMKDKIFNTFRYSPWDKFYKASFIKENNINFQPVFRSNDVYFVCMSLVKSNSITVLNKTLAYYRTGMTTNSQATNHMYPLSFYDAFLKLKKELISSNYYDDTQNSFIISVLSASLYNLNSQKTYSGFKTVYDHIVTNFENDFGVSEFEKVIATKQDSIKKHYQNYKLMLENSVDDYLALKEKYFIDEDDTSLKISVIIPVYNVEKYLQECLDSVINQTLENIEIICINDGSTDSSIDILREYASKDNRITVLNQVNKGLSATRNKGIQVAKGKYIYFLDSDDMIVPYALERMYEEVITNNLDVLYFDGKSFFETAELENRHYGLKTSYVSNFKTNVVLSGAKMFAKMQSTCSYRVSACLLIIKTDFLKQEKITFINGIIHEDNFFMFQTILIAERVKHIQEQLFLRRVRLNSTITQNITFERFYGFLVNYIEMLDYSNKFEYTEDVEIAVIKDLNRISKRGIDTYNQLSTTEQNRIEILTKLERYYFDAFFAPKLQLNNIINNPQITTKTISDNETNKLTGQLRWARETLESVRAQRLELKKELKKVKGIEASASYKIGRMITWLPRKLRELF